MLFLGLRDWLPMKFREVAAKDRMFFIVRDLAKCFAALEDISTYKVNFNDDLKIIRDNFWSFRLPSF